MQAAGCRLQGAGWDVRGVIIVVPVVHSQQCVEDSAIWMQEVHSNSTLCGIQGCITTMHSNYKKNRERKEGRDTGTGQSVLH